MAMKLLQLSFLLIACISNTYSALAAREIPTQVVEMSARLSDVTGYGCWDALGEIKSCMSEIESYFIYGTIDIGPPCCQAIAIITHHCWPAVLSAVGIDTEQSHILRGYCDAESAAAGGVVSFAPVSTPPLN